MANQKTISVKEFKALTKAGRVGNAQKGDKAKAEMWEVVKRFALEGDAEKEYKFDERRKFKFDFAIYQLKPNGKKVAIEYEGLMSAKSGHTTIKGYTSNCEKYNLAAKHGWIVLRYTALNYKQLENDLASIL